MGWTRQEPPEDERHGHRLWQNSDSAGAFVVREVVGMCLASQQFSHRSQSKAPSFQAKKSAEVRMATKTHISKKATSPTRLNTTAQGNMNTISISNKTKSRATTAYRKRICTQVMVPGRPTSS